MKATDLAKIIYECDIHALTDYYSFVEVKYDDADNDTISVFRHGYDCKKHVPKGMYLWFSPNEDEAEEFKGILERYINNLTGDFSICFSEHLTGHPIKHTKHKSSSRMIWM